MTARREPLATTAALLLLGGLLACKPKQPAHSPKELADDIAKIEAALEQREDELGRAGIVVARRSPTAKDAAQTETPAEPIEDTSVQEPTGDPEPTGDEALDAPPSEPTTTTAERPTDAGPVQPAAEAQLLRARRAGNTARNRAKRSRARPLTRCEKICELAQTTCELRDRVCTMAGDHPDDVRYEAACRRAGDQCSAATLHCDSCAV